MFWKVLTENLRLQQEAAAPLQSEIHRLRAEKDALDLVNDQLTNDVGYWKERSLAHISKAN